MLHVQVWKITSSNNKQLKYSEHVLFDLYLHICKLVLKFKMILVFVALLLCKQF